MERTAADLTALASVRIGPGDIGRCVFVSTESVWYEALLEGEGLDKWQARIPNPYASGRIQSYTRTFAFDDPDVALASHTATIDFGDPLPGGAVVLSTSAVFGQQWSDGDTGTFELDVGLGPTPDYFTAAAYDIDGGSVPAAKPAGLPVGNAKGEQVTVTITGSVNLNTASAGVTLIQLVFVVPEDTEYVAPEAE
jgi:hypothetical protein